MNRQHHSARLVFATLLLSIFGCGTVDPTVDYATTSAHLERVSGEPYLWRADPAIEAPPLEVWLADGLGEDEAVKLALWYDAGLREALLDVGIAKADLVQAGLWSNPKIDIAVRFPLDGGATLVEGTLAQGLADFWQVPARERSASARLDRTILRVADRMAASIRDVRVAFVTANAADEKATALAEAATLSSTMADVIAERERAGAALASDTSAMRSAAADAGAETAIGRLLSSEARSDLLRRIGDAPLDRQIALAVDSPSGALLPSSEELSEVARNARLDLAAAHADVKAADAAVQEERGKVWRVFDIGPNFEDQSSTDVGPALSFELPIFDQNQAAIARAEFELTQAVERRDGLIRRIDGEIAALIERARLARELEVAYVERVIPERMRGLELARQAVQAGRAPVLALLDAQGGLVRARLGSIDARLARQIAEIDLERAVASRLSPREPDPPTIQDG